MAVINHVKPRQATGGADPVITNLVAGDHIPWYQKRNLRTLYILLFPTCMGIELTSGFDSQLINALQIVPSWVECKSSVATGLALVDQAIQIFIILKGLSRVLSAQPTRSVQSYLYPSSPW